MERNAETYKPTESMASAAKRALEIRDKQPDSNKGMTSVGLTRARQLIAREPLSLDTVKRMYSFFSRHEVDKKGEGWGKDSKGYQAWMGWGGNAGFSWSRKIVESQKAQNMQTIIINSTVRKSQIVDNGNHWLIKGIPVTADGKVMNGIRYPADENAKGMPSIVNKPITGGHPVRDGYPISASSEDMGEWYIGANITKHYNNNGINYVDVKAYKKSMRNSENKLGEYFADKLERREPFGVSTGLTLKPVQNDAGEPLATNQSYDHLAFLHDSEAPAGGQDTMVRFNSDLGVMAINIDRILEELDDDDDIEEERDDDRDERMFNRFMKAVNNWFCKEKDTRYNSNETITNHEVDPMREIMLAALAAKGMAVNSEISDADLLAKYTEMTANQQKEPTLAEQIEIAVNEAMSKLKDKQKIEDDKAAKDRVEGDKKGEYAEDEDADITKMKEERKKKREKAANKFGFDAETVERMTNAQLDSLLGSQAGIHANAAGENFDLHLNSDKNSDLPEL